MEPLSRIRNAQIEMDIEIEMETKTEIWIHSGKRLQNKFC